MKELDPAVFVAVFQEMLGLWFWPLIALAAFIVLLCLYVLARDRRVVSARLLLSELLGLAGGVFGIWLAFTVTSSDWADIGGPIDWVLLIAIFAAGTVGGIVFAYGLLGLRAGRRRSA
jgi:hypothetical protein